MYNCTYYFIVDRLQSRSQDFAKGGGGGFFWSLIQPKTNLTQIFISLTLDWGGFAVKIRWFPKKEKEKVFTEIHWVFPAEIRNSRVFPAEIRWSKKKVFTDFGWAPEPKKSTVLVQTTASFSQLRLPNPIGGGLFSFLEQKSASKALKTCYFA